MHSFGEANELAETLSKLKPELIYSKDSKQEIAKEHGRATAVIAEYSLDQVILEYHIFRHVLFEVLEEKVRLSPESRDRTQSATLKVEQELRSAWKKSRPGF